MMRKYPGVSLVIVFALAIGIPVSLVPNHLTVMTLLLAGGELERVLGGWPYMLTAAAAVVIAIGLAASLGPMVRYVRMRPIETLRVDG